MAKSKFIYYLVSLMVYLCVTFIELLVFGFIYTLFNAPDWLNVATMIVLIVGVNPFLSYRIVELMLVKRWLS